MDTSAFIQQFETATSELGVARETMVAQMREFSGDATRLDLPPTAMEAVGTRIDDQYAAVESTQRSALENSRALIEQTHQEVDASVAELLSSMQSLATSFDELAGAHADAVATEQQAFEDAVRELDEGAREQEENISGKAGELSDALVGANEMLEAGAAEIESELTPKLGDGIDAFTEAVSGSMSQTIQGAFERGTSITEETFQTAVAEVGQAFAGALGDLDSSAQEIQGHVAESLKGSLEDGAEQLVEGATQRMAEEVIEGVVMSQTGVAVTTALGPYLPALIAIKRTTDVIKHGLELLKKVTTLGMG